MPIRKSDDISNDPAINSRLKTTAERDEILQRFDPTKVNNILPCDGGLAYLSEKVDQCIDTINTNETAVSSSGTVEKAKVLNTTRTIGGVSFNGSANIDLPGVNESGTQNTSGRAATATLAAEATILATARNIGGVSFDGSANINLPGVNTTGNQNTSGNAATSTLAIDATTLATARTIGGVSFDGSASIVPRQHKGSTSAYYLTPGDFYPHGARQIGDLVPDATPSRVVASQAGMFTAFITLPLGIAPYSVVVYGSDSRNVVNVYMSKFGNATIVQIDGGSGFAVNTDTTLSGYSDWSSDTFYLAISVTTDGSDAIYGGKVTMR